MLTVTYTRMHPSFASGRNIVPLYHQKSLGPSDQKPSPRKPSDQNTPRVSHVSAPFGSRTNKRFIRGMVCDMVVADGSTCTNQMITRVILSRLHKVYESIRVWRVAFGGKVYATSVSLEASINLFDPNSMWAVRSKFNQSEPSDRNPISTRVMLRGLHKWYEPISVRHVAYVVLY